MNFGHFGVCLSYKDAEYARLPQDIKCCKVCSCTSRSNRIHTRPRQKTEVFNCCVFGAPVIIVKHMSPRLIPTAKQMHFEIHLISLICESHSVWGIIGIICVKHHNRATQCRWLVSRVCTDCVSVPGCAGKHTPWLYTFSLDTGMIECLHKLWPNNINLCCWRLTRNTGPILDA